MSARSLTQAAIRLLEHVDPAFREVREMATFAGES